jgi:acyl-CoA dehydrogenase
MTAGALALDDRLTVLRDAARDWASALRPYSLAVDRDPEVIRGLTGLEAVARSAYTQIPPAYQPDPLTLAGHRFYLMSASERVVFCEEMARADLGMMLGLPGASMTGVLVDVLGDDAQKTWFYGRLLERPTWTCFALTEPDGGSDAAAMRTRLRPDGDGFVLTGAKKYVSNALRASLGVVFHRTGDGPLSVGAALVETDDPGLRATAVETIGVRGAQLGAITLDAVPVRRDRVLGHHLSPVRRGMWGWLRTFNLLRPTVASMAVGLAQAAHDYVRDHRATLTREEDDRLDRLARRIEAARQLTRRAALMVDRDPSAGHLASAAKLLGAQLAEHATVEATRFFGVGARLEHPLLEKLGRDARALEYMEGTGNVQRLSLFAGLMKDTTAWRPGM